MATVFSVLDEKLGKRPSRKVANNTYLERRGEDAIALRLHATDIAVAKKDHAGHIVLTSGGYKTMTTKDRLNEFLRGSGLQLWQARGVWTLSGNGVSGTFRDGVTLYGPATSLRPVKATLAPVASTKREDKLRKQIKAYADLCAKSMPLPMPDGGDCWMCLMLDGKASRGTVPERLSTDHLLDHMREGYVVPSLVWNALLYAGCAPQGTGCAYFWAAFDEDSRMLASIGTKRMARFITRYLGRCFGLITR